MKKILVVAVALMCWGGSYAADASEQGVKTAPLKIYSGGFGLGGVAALNDELKNGASNQFLKLTITNSFAFREHAAFFLDADWFLMGNNFGADLGFDYFFTSSDIRPFAGLGVGAHYFDKSDVFGDNVGPSLTAHVGCTIDLTETVAIRVRLPYHVVMNKAVDQVVGLDIAFLFSSRLKNVKQLQYN